jgi:tripartite-type tricarboxylate transporter receptor subunit TctC
MQPGVFVLTRRRLLALSAGSALTASLSGRAALAQMQSLDWPNRVVRFIVPFAAGGPTDIVARIVAEQLGKIWGQQVVIENRGGAGTNIGNEMVARSDPDGYTVLFATASLAVNRSLYRSLSYDPIADFAAVSLVSRFSLFMFVPNSLPAKSVMEFVAYAKAHPGKLTLASPGTGSTPHLAGELLKQMARIEMTHVPYRGGGPAVTDLLGGQVQVYFATTASSIEHIKSGKLRALAVTTATRVLALPGIPALAEFLPGYDASIYVGIVAPRATPAEIISKLNQEINLALADSKITRRIAELGDTPLSLSSSEFAKLIADETEKWGKVIRAANVKAE